MNSWKQFEKKVAKAISSNSIAFLRRSANEIVKHDDFLDTAFDRETGTMVTVLTQMALELAIASYIVKHDGIRAILTKPTNLSDSQIHKKWKENSLRTKTFEEYKALMKSRHHGIYSSFSDITDNFQKSRNKIMHLYFEFSETDLYNLKYQATFILIHAISSLIFEDQLNHSYYMEKVLSKRTLKKLVQFPPYQKEVKKLAKINSNIVLNCPICEQRAFSDTELMCFSCTYQDQLAQLLQCPSCNKNSVIFDHLNLPDNDEVPSLCLNCEDRQLVYECICGEPRIFGNECLFCETA